MAKEIAFKPLSCDRVLMAQLAWVDDQVTSRRSGPAPSVRSGRRLSDKILVAFHHACDQADLETAQELLHVAGRAVARANTTMSAERRRCREALVAAHERLWHLRHRFEDDC